MDQKCQFFLKGRNLTKFGFFKLVKCFVVHNSLLVLNIYDFYRHIKYKYHHRKDKRCDYLSSCKYHERLMNIHYKAKLRNGPNTDLKTASCYDSFRYIRTTLCRLCSVLQIRQEPFGYHFTKPIIVKFVKKDCIENFFQAYTLQTRHEYRRVSIFV